MNRLIRDVKEFTRLFRIRIPVLEETDYYLHTLSRSPEYGHIPRIVEDFARFERANPNPGSVKMETVSHLKDQLAETATFANLEAFEIDDFELPFEKKHPTNVVVASLNLVRANYNIFTCFDTSDELPREWKDYCRHQEVPGILAKSKSFRQLVFGHLNPKKLQRLQKLYLLHLAKHLVSEGFSEEDIWFRSSEELAFVLGDREDAFDNYQKLNRILDKVNSGETPEDFPDTFKGRIKLSSSYARWEHLGRNQFIVHYLHAAEDRFIPAYRSLYGIPGSRFYLCFKQYVLRDRVDERDLLFYHEGELAKWYI